jgi:phosphoglycerol transferase
MGKAIASLALIATLGVGRVGPNPVNGMADTAEEYRGLSQRDAAFFGRLEASLPRGASVVQIPHMSYPESPPIHHLRDYEHFRAYLHTRTLRFSYGAMRGRYWDGWLHDALSKHRLGDSLEALAAVGFHALLVDR